MDACCVCLLRSLRPEAAPPLGASRKDGNDEHEAPDVGLDRRVMAHIALGLRFPRLSVLALIKSSLFPLAFVRATNRRWWLGLALLGLASAFAGLWFDCLQVVANPRNSGPLYGVQEVTMMLIPIVVWLARRSTGGQPESSLRGRVASRRAQAPTT
jgi:hypothetical protein